MESHLFSTTSPCGSKDTMLGTYPASNYPVSNLPKRI